MHEFCSQKKKFIYVETIWRLSYVPCNTCVAGSGNTFLFETTTVSCFCELVFLFPTNCCLWKTVNVFSQDAVFHVKEICCPMPGALGRSVGAVLQWTPRFALAIAVNICLFHFAVSPVSLCSVSVVAGLPVLPGSCFPVIWGIMSTTSSDEIQHGDGRRMFAPNVLSQPVVPVAGIYSGGLFGGDPQNISNVEFDDNSYHEQIFPEHWSPIDAPDPGDVALLDDESGPLDVSDAAAFGSSHIGLESVADDSLQPVTSSRVHDMMFSRNLFSNCDVSGIELPWEKGIFKELLGDSQEPEQLIPRMPLNSF